MRLTEPTDDDEESIAGIRSKVRMESTREEKKNKGVYRMDFEFEGFWYNRRMRRLVVVQTARFSKVGENGAYLEIMVLLLINQVRGVSLCLCGVVVWRWFVRMIKGWESMLLG